MTPDKEPHWDQCLCVAHLATELLSALGGLLTCWVLPKALPYCAHIALWEGGR